MSQPEFTITVPGLPVGPDKDSRLTQRNDPLDASTFICPAPYTTSTITIEFCDRCRCAGHFFTRETRLHRATWIQTELLLTFPPPTLGCISIVPLNDDETAGRFRVWLSIGCEPAQLVWDRKIEGGFPELKVLVSRAVNVAGVLEVTEHGITLQKQRIRDRVQPGKSLGHSDKKV